jgi:hypothetical protein
MADTGWKYAASGRNINKGYTDWLSPANVAGSADDTWTTNSLTANTQGDELNAYNFSMGVPAGKQIDGIYICILKKCDSDLIKDYTLYLMNDTAHKGSDGGDSVTDWPASTWIYHGGIADLWGAAWTAAQVNASTFGIGLRIKNHHASAGRTGQVDSMSIKIYYSDPISNDHLMMMGM